jgi:3-isopropylmalate dehydrogenase
VKAEIVLLPGDGIGPEVVEQARTCLEAIGRAYDHSFSFQTSLIGGAALDETGEPLPESTLEACRAADAVLLGAVGGPKWSSPRLSRRPEQGLLGLRKALGLYANLRPIRVMPAATAVSPLRPERLDGVDILFVRELTGGLYFGEPRGIEQVGGQRRAIDTLAYSEAEIRRVVDLAFRLAIERKGKVTSVDKANVLESSRLWREVAEEVSAAYPDIELEHQLVDSAAMRLMLDPSSLDVIVTENMFGDILTDEASVLVGSLGLLPSASLGESGGGVYEPIHGSAPDLAGKALANPIGAILSAAMLLRHALKLHDEAKVLEAAAEACVAEGARTADLGGELSTTAVGEAVRMKVMDLAGDGTQADPAESRP